MEIIAEIGINHNGDVKLAKQMIDVAAASGCDYVKFQKRTVSEVYTDEELDAPRESPWGTTNREQKFGLEFSMDEYRQINTYCAGKIKWFASPWDHMSVGFLHNFKPPFMKIASASLTDKDVLQNCVTYNYPVILSTGMSTLEELDAAIKIVGEERVHCIMHCTSTYPTKTEEMNLLCIPVLQKRYNLLCIPVLQKRYPWATIGFSNHHPGIVFMPAAVALGAKMVEFHITMDKTMYGSDQAASFNPEGVFKAVKYMREVEKSLGDGIKRVFDSEIPIREKLRR
jgi:N-acetylneuraminate synthase